MTEAATKFVAPLTFETLTRQPVLLDMWSLAYSHRIGHIEATQRADLFVVAPATARTIARLPRAGDDFWFRLASRARCGSLPWLRMLSTRPCFEGPPRPGYTSSAGYGASRLRHGRPRPSGGAIEILARNPRRQVVRSPGPAQPLTPSASLNRSSGKMGYAVAGRQAT
jgi:phosphopantothenoylcysteine decarboxylase/phosphopantothenate--cysteine ligase